MILVTFSAWEGTRPFRAIWELYIPPGEAGARNAPFPSVRPARDARRARSARRVPYKLASYKRPHELSKDIKGGGPRCYTVLYPMANRYDDLLGWPIDCVQVQQR